MAAPECRRPFITGIVLAAGDATRMGALKQLLPLAGRPLLGHVIEAAAGSSLDEVVVVLGHEAAMISARLGLARSGRVRAVVNTEYRSGQGSSLRAGLRAADRRARAAAILLGDMPGVTSALIDRVTVAFLAGGRPVARPVYTTVGRAVPGHPVLLDREAWRETEELRGDLGVRALLERHKDWLLEVPVEGGPPPDVDTKEDYRALLTRHEATRAGTAR